MNMRTDAGGVLQPTSRGAVYLYKAKTRKSKFFHFFFHLCLIIAERYIAVVAAE